MTFNLNLKGKLYSIRRHPSILKDMRKWKNIEDHGKILDEKEIKEFLSKIKNSLLPYYVNSDDKPKLNRLCHVEDWNNSEVKTALSELQKLNPEGYIHRKDWEWALGLIAMKRFGKLNQDSKAIGVGVGREAILFYLAKKISHVYATDIYDKKEWNEAAPYDFPENPKKYAPYPYKEDALTVLRMDGTKLDFPSESFDIAFSFSSIEHFGGRNHSGALKSLREMERVLKQGGIAVITTEYILNDKEHPEFFNKRTIYSDLINKLEKLRIVEPLDLRITSNTLDTIIDYFEAKNWGKLDREYIRTHPHIVIKYYNILLTSVMVVLQK